MAIVYKLVDITKMKPEEIETELNKLSVDRWKVICPFEKSGWGGGLFLILKKLIKRR